jgi:hypothetical protein
MAAASRFAWVARWADLHEPEILVRREGGHVEARRRQAWQVDTDGIPAVTTAGVVQLGMLLQTSTRSAECLLRDVLEIRHRLPRTWHGVMTGNVEDWKARQVAKSTRHLKEEHARWVDEQLGDVLATLPWGRALAVVEGKVIAADPATHEARLTEDEAKRFVSTRRRSNVHGLRTMIARGTAGDISRLEAMVSHIASAMLAAGDEDVLDTRRAKALALLANPALACVFLAGMKTTAPLTSDSGQAETPPQLPSRDERDAQQQVEQEPAVQESVAQAPSAAELAQEFGRVLREMGAVDKLRPRTVLYIHLSEAAVEGVRAAQVARVEDPVAAGPISIDQLREWLKNDRIIVKPVIDPFEAVPVDCYEIPTRLHEAQSLLTPFEVFPYGTQPARQADDDHTIPYVPPDEGGPPGQTAIGNLGPLGRRHHLAKTFSGFTVHQPVPGLYYWRTPTGWWYQVDHRGTRPLGRDRPAAVSSPVAELDPRQLSMPEQAFRQSILMHLAS